MTSAENSISEPPNLKIFCWIIPPEPPPPPPLQGLCLRHSQKCPSLQKT